MRVVIKILKLVTIIYLFTLGLIALIFYMDKRGNKKYVNIRGISYVVVDNDYLSPDIPSSTVVLLKKASIDEVNEGEFALVYDGGVAKLKKIIKKITAVPSSP